MLTRLSTSLALCIVVGMPGGQVSAADEVAQTPVEAGAVHDSVAKERYERLMEQAEGEGRKCMIASTFKDETLAALKRFGEAVRFIDLEPHKPIKVELPESYYHPLGRTITFDRFDLAIDRRNPSNPYISMTRTSEGVKLESKVAIQLEDGKIVCVRNLSATVGYKAAQ